jgi:hypothetical protein
MHTGRGGRGKVRKIITKNAITHEKGDPLDFLTAPSTSLKRIWPKPQGPPPPGFPTTVHLYFLNFWCQISRRNQQGKLYVHYFLALIQNLKQMFWQTVSKVSQEPIIAWYWSESVIKVTPFAKTKMDIRNVL